jgi:TRAP-type C4-dicarboxylate transport system permease small subunit
MQSFWSLLDKSHRFMRGVASVCLLGMALITCTDVILRSTINQPIFGSEEIVSIFAIMTIGFALPFAHRKNAHVGVEFFYRLLTARNRKRIKVCTDLVSFFLFLVLGWQMFGYGLDTQNSGALSMNLELPMYWFVYVLSFCLFIVAFCMLQDILLFLRGDDKKK